MTPLQIKTIYLFVLAAYFFTELVLLLLNKRNLEKYVVRLPELESFVEEETYQKSRAYSIDKLKFSIFSHFTGIIITLLVVFALLPAIFSTVANMTSNEYFQSVYISLFLLIFSLICNLPLELYSTFVIESKYGFNKATLKLFLFDKLKGALLGLVLVLPLVIGFVGFLRLFPTYWWLLAYIAFVVFQFTLIFIYPSWIAPIFNKFTPLKNEDLKRDIFDLANQTGFETSGIYEMDGSRRSSHSNAYFTGFGKNRRIVLFDTLISSLETKELLAVLAHEIGHQKLNHIKKSLILNLALLLLIFWLMGKLSGAQVFYSAFGLSQSGIALLLLFMLLSSPFMYFISPIFSALSRRFEYQADNYAAKILGSEPMKNALIKLNKSNLSNYVPHPAYSTFHYSHPTLKERLSALKSL